jgi:6-phosphogluconolactonase (cycloisomerase 2 family)
MQLAREHKAQVCWILLIAASLLNVVLLGCGSNGTPTPPPAPLGHAYVVASSTTYGYSIAASDGALQVLDVSAGLPGVGKSVTSNGQDVYVLNGSGQITAYQINSDFTLSQLANSPFSGAPSGVAFVAIDPAGKNLFVPVPGDSAVLPYAIDATTGNLTVGVETATPAPPLTATVDFQDRFLYVPMDSGGTQLFQLSGDVLTSVKTIPPLASGKSEFVAITPNNQFAYIADGVSGIAAYSVNQTTGDLTPIVGTPYGTLTGPSTLAITPNGKYIYVANAAGISSFTINSDGTLTGNQGLVALGNPATELAVDVTGTYLYGVVVQTNLISVFHIDSSGKLAAQPAVPVASTPNSIVLIQ